MNFFVPGIPIPKGSVRALHHRSTGSIITIADNDKKLRAWNKTIATHAVRAVQIAGWHMDCDVPLCVSLDFMLARPKSSKRAVPTTKPDLDKLIRAVLDASTKIIWYDDAQAVDIRATKKYGDPGVLIGVSVAP